MGIQVGDNFDHKSKKPLDARTSYTTLALMKAVTDANIPEGCLAYCAETDKYYKFLSTNTVDASTGKWREFSSGGGGGSEYIVELTSLPTADASLYALYPYGEATAKMVRLVNMQANYQVGCYYQVRRTGSEGSYEYHWVSIDCVTGEITFNSSDFVTSHPSDSSSTHKYTKVELSGAYYRSDSSSYPDNTDLANDDKFPMYDASVTGDKRRNITWQNLKARLKAYFDTIYAAFTAGNGINISNQVISTDNMPDTDMSEIMDTLPSTQPRVMKYSEDEQVVGEWIDGKPLYQKVLTSTMPEVTTSGTAAAKTIDIGASIDDIAHLEGYVYQASNNQWFAMPVSNLQANAHYTSMLMARNNSASTDANCVRIACDNRNMSEFPVRVIVRYTKTTDTANT